MSRTPEQASVEERARQIIYEDPHFNSTGRVFGFKYEERALTVEGRVSSFHLKQLLCKLRLGNSTVWSGLKTAFRSALLN